MGILRKDMTSEQLVNKRKYDRNWWNKNKEKIREKRKFYKNNYKILKKDKIDQTNKEYRMKLKTIYRERFLLNTARCRAKRKGIPFGIEVKDIIIPEFCPILGIKLQVAWGKVQANSPSLDKIIPKLGYVKGNIQVISYKANAMKNSASIQELCLFAQWVQRNFGENNDN